MEVVFFRTTPADRALPDGQGFEQDGTKLISDIRVIFESDAERREFIARSGANPRPGEMAIL
jgi:hypothetical protein